MTKVTIIGEEPKAEKELKAIEFTHLLTVDKEIIETEEVPHSYNYIELICKRYSHYKNYYFDLMFAYNGDRNNGELFLGHFNDGVVK